MEFFLFRIVHFIDSLNCMENTLGHSGGVFRFHFREFTEGSGLNTRKFGVQNDTSSSKKSKTSRCNQNIIDSVPSPVVDLLRRVLVVG